MIRLGWGSATDVGRVRQENEDSVVTSSSLFVVADGMGGHRGGEVASGLAADVARERLRRQRRRPLDRRAGPGRPARQRGGGRRAASSDPDLAGMGTTLCAMALVEIGRRRAARHRQRRRLARVPAQGRRARADHRRPQPGGHPRAPGSPHARRGRGPPAAQHPHPRPRHRRPGDGRLVGGAARRRRSLPALQRRPVQRGRREPDGGDAAQAGRPDRGGARARPPGQRGRRTRQHHRRHRRRDGHRRRRRRRRGRLGRRGRVEPRHRGGLGRGPGDRRGAGRRRARRRRRSVAAAEAGRRRAAEKAARPPRPPRFTWRVLLFVIAIVAIIGADRRGHHLLRPRHLLRRLRQGRRSSSTAGTPAACSGSNPSSSSARR